MSVDVTPFTPLTKREKEILRLRRDLLPKQIARHLFLAHGTVKNHLRRAVRKLGARDTHHAVLVDYVMQTVLREE